jgi:hypothetical protein
LLAVGEARQRPRNQALAGREIVAGEHGVGRGHASTVKLLFAQSGPWHEGEVNANLLEAVLG